MIFLDYLYELPNATSGIDSIVSQMTSGSFYWITPIILFFVFLVVFLGGITRQKLRSIQADYSAWAVVASISTFLVALLFSISAGFIRLDWLVIVVVITIFSGIWFFLDRRPGEV